MPPSATLRSGFCLTEAALTERIHATPKAPSTGFVHIDDVRAIQVVLAELGAEFGSLVVEAGLDPQIVDGRTTFVPFTAIGRLIALAADRTHCPHLGLLVGERVTLASQWLLGSLLCNCDTVGDALRVLEAHLCVQDRGGVVGLGVFDEVAALSYTPYEPEIVGAALHSERALAKLTNVLRALCGARWAPLEVLLPRSAPDDITPYGTFFRAPVRFDQEMTALVFPASLLQQPIAGADPAVRRRLEEQIRRIEVAQPSKLTDELRYYLRATVIKQRCKAERIARLRLVNRRTLSRRLRAEGTSFRQLTNEAQFAVAKQLLADTNMTLTQISGALNFSEPAAFTHAFRRWSGIAPSVWRKERRPATRCHVDEEKPPLDERRDDGCNTPRPSWPAPSPCSPARRARRRPAR